MKNDNHTPEKTVKAKDGTRPACNTNTAACKNQGRHASRVQSKGFNAGSTRDACRPCRFRPGGRLPLSVLVVILLLVLSALMTACRSSVQATADRRDTLKIRVTDTLYRARTIRDTVFRTDSVFQSLERRGDTVYLTRERWRERVKTVFRTDTVYRTAVRDTARAAALTEKKETVKTAPPAFPVKGFLCVILFFTVLFAAILVKNGQRY